MRRACYLDSKLLIPPGANTDARVRGTEHEHKQECSSLTDRLYPESAIERAILNRLAHMLG